MKKLLLLASCLCLFGTGLVGCQNTAEGAKEDTQKNGAAVANATDNAADKTKDAMGNAGDNLNLKPKLALAFTNDAKLKDTNVDTDIKDGKVILKGSVKTNDQKKEAAAVAQKTMTEAGSKDTLLNQLTVTTH